MFKNKNTKKFIIAQAILFALVVLIITSTSLFIYKTYSNSIENNSNKIISSIITKHPELEEEVIASLDDDIEYTDILHQYGITSLEIEESKNLQNKIISLNISVVMLSMVVFIIITLIYLKKEYNSLNNISLSINKVLNNDYKVNIKDYNDGFISNLNNDVHKVITKLKEQRDLSVKDKIHLEETLSDISHQLRTPLTSMYVINDLLDTNLSKEKQKEFLAKNRAQLERIEWLVTSLLKLSRLDSGTTSFKKEKVNVLELVNAAINPVRINLELKEIELVLNIPETIFINVDFNWTKEALLNIIKNAYEHTPKEGRIEISASTNPIYTEIRISDTGCGISKKDLKHIFDRFYKINKDSDSIGIGLNMTKRIINEENGEVLVETDKEKGTVFIIRLYKNFL